MAVSDLAPANLVSTGQTSSGAAASSFGTDFDLVELDTDSSLDSVTELGGPGMGFDLNRTPVTIQPRFAALDLRNRVSAEELARRSAVFKLARKTPVKRKRPNHSMSNQPTGTTSSNTQEATHSP